MRSILRALKTGIVGGLCAATLLLPAQAQGQWEEVARFAAPPAMGRTALSDGKHIVLQPNQFPNQGIPFYELRNRVWMPTTLLTFNTSMFPAYASSAALDDEWAVIRASTPTNEVWLCFFHRIEHEWQLFQEIIQPIGSGSTFGYGMQLSGEALAVSDYGAFTGGMGGVVWVYEFDGVDWELAQAVQSSSPVADMRFGRYVTIEGNRLVATAPGDAGGAIYVLERQEGVWNETARLPRPQSYHGGPVDLSGDRFVMGQARDPVHVVPFNGMAYVYELVTGTWTEVAALPDPLVEQGTYFGNAVAIEGDRAVIAGPYDGTGFIGHLFVYEFNGSAWLATETITAPDPTSTIGESLSLVGNQLVFTEVPPWDTVVYDFAAGVTVRNGSGVNTSCYTAISPLVGGTWTASVDVTGHPGATLTVITGLTQPTPGTSTKFGEILVTGGTVFSSSAVPQSGLSIHSSNVPDEPSLSGLTAYSQALILGGTRLELCNAIDLTVGF